MIAVLYIDPRGPYPKMGLDQSDPDPVNWAPRVDCYDATRDARTYAGPYPVVAHPPCGPWGRLRHLYKGDEHDYAPRAVAQVRAFGGVLEHPAGSKLWDAVGLPKPGEWNDYGGYTIEVDQVEWGHACRKPTWLYLVGVPREALESPPFPGREPTHGIFYGRWERSGHKGPKLLGASKEIRRRTPPMFAEYLVRLARAVRR